uniref:T-cell surface glycoprotein CD3 delta chain n=1 Tax=Canis lupus familiaris TaxID=9615 RepID=A0A8P0TD26_CANLF
MEHCRFLAGLILAVLLSRVSPFKVSVEELEDRVFLSCNTSVLRIEGTMGIQLPHSRTLDLGKRILDPRGIYRCNATEEQSDKAPYMQVYYRMCQNCVELNSATLAGIVIADIIATLLLALGVYCFAGHETGRSSKCKWKGQSVHVCMYMRVVGVSVHLLRMGLAMGCVSSESLLQSPKNS